MNQPILPLVVALGIFVAAACVGYVVVALLGRVMLNEAISPRRWMGILLIMAGVALAVVRAVAVKAAETAEVIQSGESWEEDKDGFR